MKQFDNKYAQKIHAILVPLVGDFMAAGILKKQSEMLGITEETLDLKHLPQMSENIKRGLAIFLGAEKAQYISTFIKDIR